MGQDGYVFRVFAPNAVSVAVMGEFNGWSRTASGMQRDDRGVWELFIPGVKQYDAYKYAIETPEGYQLDKADPYAFHSETRPAMPRRYSTWRDTNGRTAAGSHGGKTICPMNSLSIFMKCTSARGKCMKTAASTPTASSLMS